MSKKIPSKDEALEALDFIVNVLKEHEKDLDRLVGELATVASQLGESGELSLKVKKIEDKINSLQENVTSLVKSFSNSQRLPTDEAEPSFVKENLESEGASLSVPSGISVLLKCKDWEDFQKLAIEAQTVSFTFKEPEKTLEVDALKNNQIITYTGELPKLSQLLKMYLSKQLAIREKQILEGDMALG